MSKDIEVIFIRHAETHENKEKRYIGHTDVSVSDEGIEKIKNNKYEGVQIVFSSPLKRCIETAVVIYQGISPVIIEGFKEMNFGDFEGKNYDELNGNEDYQKYINSNGEAAFPNGESKKEFTSRTMKAFDEMLEILMEKQKTKAAAIVHGGTIMAVLSTILGGDYYNYHIGNGKSVSVIRNNGKWKLNGGI